MKEWMHVQSKYSGFATISSSSKKNSSKESLSIMAKNLESITSSRSHLRMTPDLKTTPNTSHIQISIPNLKSDSEIAHSLLNKLNIAITHASLTDPNLCALL